MCQHIELNDIYKTTMAGFRKNHSTEKLLMKIRDDITRAMGKGEVTLVMFLDYSKAFDTVDYKTLLVKLRKFGFSLDSTMLLLSYLTERKQFVQVMTKNQHKKLFFLVFHKDRYLVRYCSTCTRQIYKIM